MPSQTIATPKPGNELQSELNLLFECEVDVFKTGMVLPSNLDFDSWRKAGHVFNRLRLKDESQKWCLADWLAFGGDNFCETDELTGKWKQTPEFSRYLMAAEATGYEVGELKQIAAIGRAMPIEVRFSPDKLSFDHHAIVGVEFADPKVQRQWLEKAIAERWNASELRQAVRKDKADNDEQTSLPLVIGINLIGIASELEARFRRLQEKASIDKWPIEQKVAIKADAVKIRDVADSIIERIV